MAYDEDLADRIRAVIDDPVGVTERRMFGSLAFLVNGHLAVGASKDGLLLRVDQTETDSLVAVEGISRFEMRGRELNGWLHVDTSALATDEGLRRWVGIGLGYAASLPPK